MARLKSRIWRSARPRKGRSFLAVAAGRIGSGFFTPMRNRSLPGRHITDCQMRLYMSFRQAETPIVAAAKAGFSIATAYRVEQDPRLPSQKRSPRRRRRQDPLAAVWDSEVVPLLKSVPGLRPVAIFDEIRRRHPESAPVSAARWSGASAPGGR